MTRACTLLLALLAGCTAGPASGPAQTGVDEPELGASPSDPVAETPAAGADATHLQINAGDAVPVQVTFTTVGAYHQGFFRRTKSVQKLGKALGACTDTTVEVQVVWSQNELEGRIVGQAPQGTSVCVPARLEDAFDLSPVIPSTRGLASYRDEVAGLSDFRIANFVVAVDLRAQGALCRLRTAGQHPPDGSRFDPCVEVNGERLCAAGDREKGVTTLRFEQREHARKFAACL